MRTLITGANGFIGHYLTAQLLEKGYEVIATGKGDCRLPYSGHPLFTYAAMDFTDPFAVHDVFEKFRPATVIHAGAEGKPDECELHQWQAYLTNVEGTVTLLSNAAEQQCFFLFLSTDFVFDGEQPSYSETSERAPVNYYGKTKMEAEDAVKEYEYDWSIVRTALVYGKPLTGRANILSTVREKLQKKEEYKVVDDQVRTPTFVEDVAAGIVAILGKKAKGIYHIAGKDVLTPYQMAIQAGRWLGLDVSLIKRVTAESFSQPARRPARTIFIIDKARQELGYQPVSFEEGLRKTFDNV